MIAILAAMQEELQEVYQLMQDVEVKTIYDIEYFCGKLGKQDVVLSRSGVAKINATFTTTTLLEHFPVSALLNVGSAGGLKQDLALMDVVIAAEVAQHDLDVGNEKGVLSNQPRFFPCDSRLIALGKQVQLEGIKQHIGLIVSGDQFIVSKAATQIMKDFPQAIAVEMEAAAVGVVCYKRKIPFLVVRSVSDLPYETGNEMTFDEYLQSAARNSARFVEALLCLL